jgi:glucokinase
MNADCKKNRIGFEIGGTKLQVAVSDATETINELLRFTIHLDEGAAGIRTQIEKSLANIGPHTIEATGVGFGGPVDWRTGVVQTSHQVNGWAGFDLKCWLEGLTNAPVLVDNDANVAALAEAAHGSGVGYNPVFYITIGSGIGGGMVINNEIYHGIIPGEAEIGHILLDKSGTTLESECSGWAVNKKIRNYITSQPNSLLAQLAAGSTAPEATFLKTALEKKDEAAMHLVLAVADDLSFALSHAVHLFHPQTLIIGGGLSLLGAPLLRIITERLPYYIMKAFLPAPVVQLASLSENVVPIGALELAKKALHTHKNNQL